MTDRELTIPQAHPDPAIEQIRQDVAAMRKEFASLQSGLLGAADGTRLGLHARVTALENQWGKVYALMSIPVGALIMIAVNSVFGGKHP